MKKNFQFEFEDTSAENRISFDYNEDIDEIFEIQTDKGTPVLCANQQGFMTLAKVFIKMAMCDYKDGFHINIRKDFDADRSDTLRCILKK
jgi:hypothetical protein